MSGRSLILWRDQCFRIRTSSVYVRLVTYLTWSCRVRQSACHETAFKVCQGRRIQIRVFICQSGAVYVRVVPYTSESCREAGCKVCQGGRIQIRTVPHMSERCRTYQRAAAKLHSRYVRVVPYISESCCQAGLKICQGGAVYAHSAAGGPLHCMCGLLVSFLHSRNNLKLRLLRNDPSEGTVHQAKSRSLINHWTVP